MKKVGSYIIGSMLLITLIFTSFTHGEVLAATPKVSIQQLQKSITTLKKEITTLKKMITSKDSEIKTLKSTSAKKDTEIKILKKASADKDTKINQLNSTIALKAKDIQAKDAEISALKEKLSKYDGVPVTNGNSRQNPAKLGETVTVEVDDWMGYRKYSVTLTEVISDTDAWNLIKNTNMYNDPPKAGMKYVLAKIKVKVINVEEEPFEINNSNFDAVSSSGVKYDDFTTIVAPDPSLRTDLYNGAEHEGWTYFEVKTDDNPLIVMNQKYPDEIWFKLDR